MRLKLLTKLVENNLFELKTEKLLLSKMVFLVSVTFTSLKDSKETAIAESMFQLVVLLMQHVL